MIQEKPELHLDLDSPYFSKKKYEEIITNLVNAVVTKEKVNSLPILRKRTDVREVQPMRLTAHGTSITAGIRCDDLYCVGFKSSEEKWFSCKLDDTPGDTRYHKGKGSMKRQSDLLLMEPSNFILLDPTVH